MMDAELFMPGIGLHGAGGTTISPICLVRHLDSQTTVANNLPIPAVRAIAAASILRV
jgi:hypothetical protein